MNTRLAPQRSADVAQSKAVSPAPSTMTDPEREGRTDLQAHIPGGRDEGEHGRGNIEMGGRERGGGGEKSRNGKRC